MATTQATMRTGAHAERKEVSGWTIGWAIFAGTMMLMTGIFQAFEGLTAIFNGDFFVIGPAYTYTFSVTTWGWIHMILGIVIAFAGVAVYSGQAWGRTVGIILAILSAVTNFFFIPYYPFWALLIIAVDVAIIGALAAYDTQAAGMDDLAHDLASDNY